MAKIESKNLVVKSNHLVEARYHFTLWETRVFAKAITMIKKGDTEFGCIKIYIKDLIKEFNANSNDAYRKIRAVPELLSKRQIKFSYVSEEEEERIAIVNLMKMITFPANPEFTLNGESSYIELQFNDVLKPHLLQLKEKFLKYDITHIMQMKSAHSIRIYELLKQYENIRERTFQVDALKEILGVENKYKRYRNFKARVIKQGEKDLQKQSDISFSFEEIRENRKVVAIRFFIYKNSTERTKQNKNIVKDVSLIKQSQPAHQEPLLVKPKQKTPKAQKELVLSETEIKNEAIKQMIREGIGIETARTILVNGFEDNILYDLKEAKKEIQKGKIGNPTGFIITCIREERYTKQKQAKETIKQAEQTEKAKASQEKEQKMKESHQFCLQSKEEYKKLRNEAIDKQFGHLTDDELEDVVIDAADKWHLKEYFKLKGAKSDKLMETQYFILSSILEDEKLQSFCKYLQIVYNAKTETVDKYTFMVKIQG